MNFLLNPHRDPAQDHYAAISEPLALHRILPGYAPTALIDAPALAQQLGIGRVSIKDEASRLGLPSFKILGASYAVYRALAARLGVQHIWTSLDAWRTALEPLRPCTLTTATDGNHGRAVAYMARLLDLRARIYVPQGTAQARIDAIAAEGADVVTIDGSYDQAVIRAAQDASPCCLVIADTALDKMDRVPGWVIDGYATMFNEIEAECHQRGIQQPEVVVVQMGVGALASACVRHYRQAGRIPKPFILGVEPLLAACVLASLTAGQMISLPGVQHSIMVGLNCGTPSPLAWPIISTGMDACVAIADDWACVAMRALAQAGLISGESGAAGLAGVLALAENANTSDEPARLPLTANTHMLLISTEGATDPQNYVRIVGA